MRSPRANLANSEALTSWPSEPDPYESGEHQKTQPTSRPSPLDERWMSLYDDELEIASGAGLRRTSPPEDELMGLDAPLVLPERLFYERLDDLSRRMEMLTALLQTSGLSSAQGSTAIQAVLASIAANAEGARVSSLASLARALRNAVAELVPAANVDARRSLDVLVLDQSEISRDFVALAVEAQGHIVRSAKSYDELVGLLDERLPDLVVSEASAGAVPPRQFCAVLADLLENRRTRLVIFSARPMAELTELSKLSKASAVISKEAGLPGLLAELTKLLV